uniref:Uncharacterized protein n=2 Tax=Anguilla anguilla TaxID=7936 RepID=A0A0E9R5Q0_ANGAN
MVPDENQPHFMCVLSSVGWLRLSYVTPLRTSIKGQLMESAEDSGPGLSFSLNTMPRQPSSGHFL